MEGVFGDGRKVAVCGSPASRWRKALDMECPAEVYQPSTRVYQGLPDIDYPFHDKVNRRHPLRPHLFGPQKD